MLKHYWLGFRNGNHSGFSVSPVCWCCHACVSLQLPPFSSQWDSVPMTFTSSHATLWSSSQACFSNVDFLTIHAWDFIYHCFLLHITLTSDCLSVPYDLKIACTPRLYCFREQVSLVWCCPGRWAEPVGLALKWSPSQDSHCFLQVLEFSSLGILITNFLSPVSNAVNCACLHSWWWCGEWGTGTIDCLRNRAEPRELS